VNHEETEKAITSDAGPAQPDQQCRASTLMKDCKENICTNEHTTDSPHPEHPI